MEFSPTIMDVLKVIVPSGLLLWLYSCVCDGRTTISSSSTARPTHEQRLDPVPDAFFDECNNDEIANAIASQLIVRQVISLESTLSPSTNNNTEKTSTDITTSSASWQGWPFRNMDTNIRQIMRTNVTLNKSESQRYKKQLAVSALPLHSRTWYSENDLSTVYREQDHNGETIFCSDFPGQLYSSGSSVDDRLVIGIKDIDDVISTRLATMDPLMADCSLKLNPSCEICLADYEEGDLMAWSHNNGCVHGFHKGCIVDWLQKSNHCPMCRQEYIIGCWGIA